MTRFLCSLWLLVSAAHQLRAEPPQRDLPSDPPSIEAEPSPVETPLPADDSADSFEVPSELRQPLPTLPPPDADARRRFDEAAQRRIQRALADGDASPTGDPILDGTLDAIRRQGSVLQDWPADQALYSTFPARPSPQPASAPNESHYATAEALLRSARLLAQLPDQDAERQQLIQQLRREARRCLAGTGEPAM